MKKKLFICFLLFALPVSVLAQPRAEIRLVRSLPEYLFRVYIATFCDNEPLFALTKDRVTIFEEGDRIPPINYEIERNASPTRNSCFNVALVFDNSNAIIGPAFTSAIEAGKTFVDSMTIGCQTATVISFSTTVAIREFLTSNKQRLYAALDAMNPSGENAFYDGIRGGITEIEANGTEPLRTIIALTAGKDNASKSKLSDLLKDAKYYGYRIFTIGVGNQVDTTILKTLAFETGGIFYQISDPTELPALYGKLAAFIRREFDEHVIMYQSFRSSPNERTIKVKLEICGDSTFAYRTFQVIPAMTSAKEIPFYPMSVSLGECYPNPITPGMGDAHMPFSIGNVNGRIPVILTLHDILGREVAVLLNDIIEPGRHIIHFDASALTPGMYFYRLLTDGQVLTRKMVVMR